MGDAIGVIVLIAVVGCMLYAQFGVFSKRRYPRDKEDDQ
jgi:hypothetical protein